MVEAVSNALSDVSLLNGDLRVHLLDQQGLLVGATACAWAACMHGFW